MNENTFNIVGYLKKDFQTNATVVIPILAKEYAAIVKKCLMCIYSTWKEKRSQGEK